MKHGAFQVGLALLLVVSVPLGAAGCDLEQGKAATSVHSASDVNAGKDVVSVTGPTLIGFFPEVSQKDVDADQDLAEVLSDFQYHLGGAREHLERKGVSVYELYTTEIRIHESGEGQIFVPDKERGDLGFYLVSPGKEPQVMYGVMTDVDLLIQAHHYFGFPEFGRKE